MSSVYLKIVYNINMKVVKKINRLEKLQNEMAQVIEVLMSVKESIAGSLELHQKIANEGLLIIYKKIFSKNQEIILKNVKIIEKSAR
jgi:hypothetical protein